ncbi:ABC transporter permease [Bradyrhizobium sp. CCH5-F6]|uniref:ABC transporter permease n=1 Tax=Bradyrhizobium sp. CCH5-F6 TaxID=1768753 RepID=UPI00076A445D|nr:ABC transporter permease [Bradyrhizobium sp. CCH5-F6]
MSRYATFLLRRLAQACIIVVGIVCVNFAVVHLAPGDLAEVMAGQGGGGDAGYVALLRERFGLDQPLWVQFQRYAFNLLRLDLGYSFKDNMPVATLIADKLAATAILMIASLGTAFLLGIGLGTLAAVRQNSLSDVVISLLALIGYARHAVMPVLTLTVFYMAVFIRLMRASVLNVASLDFVRTAYAKGMSRRQAYTKHVVGNALLPMITMLGVNAGGILGGSVVVETVFGWPGLGRLTFDAIFARDVNLLLGILFCSSLLVVITNLVTDLVSAWIDPRIEVSA